MKYLDEFGDPDLARRLLDDISRERYFVRTGRNFGFRLDQERVLRDMKAKSFGALLDAVFQQFAASQGAGRWGDKTPEYSLHLPDIHDLFPHALYFAQHHFVVVADRPYITHHHLVVAAYRPYIPHHPPSFHTIGR